MIDTSDTTFAKVKKEKKTVQAVPSKNDWCRVNKKKRL